eukprot:c39296_g1_i1.p1 GENE.c39296_g1_i1~~c39296_g1_i1.p1  ORF type:complete len:298 (-),score=49.13 c39296_g1_i1:58-825(-)
MINCETFKILSDDTSEPRVVTDVTELTRSVPIQSRSLPPNHRGHQPGVTTLPGEAFASHLSSHTSVVVMLKPPRTFRGESEGERHYRTAFSEFMRLAGDVCGLNVKHIAIVNNKWIHDCFDELRIQMQSKTVWGLITAPLSTLERILSIGYTPLTIDHSPAQESHHNNSQQQQHRNTLPIRIEQSPNNSITHDSFLNQMVEATDRVALLVRVLPGKRTERANKTIFDHYDSLLMGRNLYPFRSTQVAAAYLVTYT